MRKLTRAGLIKKIDAAFSRFIRKANADEYGFVECFTCGVRMRWEDSQAGHWIKRGHASVRWDQRNVKPQCPRCNLWLNGAQDAYAVALMREYGSDTLEELMRLKHIEKRWTMPELRELLSQYQET